MIKPGINLTIRYALLIILLVLFSVSSFSQSHTPRTVNINSNCKGFYEYLPVNYSSSPSTFPLIIYCGGGGSFGNGSASQLIKLFDEGIPYFININQFPSSFTVNGQTSSFIVISLQFVAWPRPVDVEDALNYILSSGYKVDQSRIYLTGLSAGGDVTWKYNTSVIRSKKLAAMVPVAGYNYPYVDTGAQYIAAANLPVWALHSNDDVSAPVSWSQNFVNKINSYNPPITAKITRVNGPSHVGTGFYVYVPSFRDGGYNIYEWMLLYRRNYPPVAIAGNDTSITLPVNSVQLNGLNSYDPENGPLTFNWTKITGPSSYLINNPGIANPVVSNLVAGTYSFQLTVTDTSNLFGRDTVRITVINPNPNILPFARAGADQQINLPQNAVVLNGTASSDNDGSIESYLWTKISGPSQFTITGNTTSIASVSNLRPGNYLFRLAVTDNESGTGYDTAQITVINPFPNQLPVANAGNDTVITLPVNSVNLNGNASYDPDGTIVSYLWSQLSGPAAALIVTPGSVNSNFQNLVAGSYQFLLTVTDDSSAVDTDSIVVTVQPAPVITNKFIKVNLFGGINPYNQGGWNNWNVTGTTNITSSNFSYSDGAASTVNAVLSYSQGVPDNGTSYGGTMCPPEVLRYTTYATAGTRTVTLYGLNNAFNYDLELYASRASTGNTTQFIINGISQSVLTDNNKTNKVTFTNLTPTAGQLVININKLNTFTYLNGFTLSERSGTPPPGNQLPIANAGADQMITLPATSVTLNGSASSDPDGYISSYLWTKVAGPSQFTIVNANSSGTVVNNLTTGIYLFELTVTDNGAATDKDTLQVMVNNNSIPPGSGDSLNCGKVFTIVVLGSSTAYGTGATPIDSSWVNKYLNYIRTKHPLNNIINLATLSLTTYEVLCPTGFVPTPPQTILPDTNRNITKALSYHPDAIIINMPSNDIALGIPQQESKNNYERTMALADSANIPVWVTTTQPRSTLSPQERIYLMEFRDWTYQRFGAKAIDFWTDVANPDGTINSSYSFGDGVHVNNNGHQLFYLRTLSERILDSLCIRKNLFPTARAGNDTAIVLPVNSIQLNGTASSDADGNITTYSWSKISGPSAGTLTNANTATATASGLVAGVYSYRLTVTDNLGAAGKDTINVTVNTAPNQPPIANAGPNITITLPANTATLSGSGTDPDGTIAAYAWVKIAGPAAGTLTNANTATATASSLVAGVYSYQLTVTDNLGATGKDTAIVTVNPAANQPPIANAGPDIIITLPTNTATLSGSGTDPDGTITAYAWVKIAGPAAGTLTNANTATATASALVAGVYSYQLTVTDNIGAIGKDTVNVTVNQPPIANAGPDINITLPTNTATLSGSGTDPDGTITAYAWVKIAGPAQGTLTNANTATATASGLVAGVYNYQLTVTDNRGATARDTIVITVNAQPPGGEKYIKVNLFGGSNPYNQGGWNNWNVTGTSNIPSSNFSYSDGAASIVNAVLNYSQGVPDNGATYGGTMCPPEVLRYTTYSTAGTRAVTLYGLNNAFNYDLELYASRANPGNATQFVINGISQSVSTDNNKANKITFTNLTPTGGQLVININKLNTFTYLNGFTLTERSGAPINTRQISQPESITNLAATPTQQSAQISARGKVKKQWETQKAGVFSVSAMPNPSNSDFILHITGNSAEPVMIRIMDISGKEMSITKLNGRVAYTILGGNLKDGIYFAEVIQGNNRQTVKLIKLN